MRLIYMAHPFGGNTANLFKSSILEKNLQQKGYHIFNPVTYFYRYDGLIPEPQIMEMCLDMLSRCDEVWMAQGWEDSAGCKCEQARAQELGMVIRYL